jgi:Resolvase, N terminal domain
VGQGAGYEIVRWFIDDAISGTSAKGRNAFEQMIASAESCRDFDTVLCYDISRFSRGGTNETGFYLHRLKMAGVDVVFAADGIPEGDEGELIQGVKSWQARQYSIKLARDTIRGQISNIRERKSAPGGMAPYGYDKQHVTADGTVLRTLRWMALAVRSAGPSEPRPRAPRALNVPLTLTLSCPIWLRRSSMPDRSCWARRMRSGEFASVSCR